MKGETAKIECYVSAYLDAEYSWTKQWTANSKQFQGESPSQLVA